MAALDDAQSLLRRVELREVHAPVGLLARATRLHVEDAIDGLHGLLRRLDHEAVAAAGGPAEEHVQLPPAAAAAAPPAGPATG